MPFTQRIGSRFVPHRSAVRITPTDIAGLQLWLKADTGLWQDAAMTTPAVADGDVVGAWADQSGNGNHATQGTTAAKPLLKLAIKNGKPVVRFDGTDDLLRIASGLPAGTSPVGVIAVVNPGATLSNEHIIMWGSYTANEGCLRFQDGGVGRVTFQDDGTDILSVSGFSAATWYIFASVYDGTNAIIRKNGGQVASAARNKNIIGTAGDIGTIKGFTAELLSGDLAELLLYDADLSGNIGLVEDYLNSRYAIY